jgi:thiamine pyrophosphate-dependent acetolactate synthase large subunit-like protein
MNSAQVLVELLKEYRVEYMFGVPGDTTMPLYDAFYAARGEITHIMTRDERSAAFMADAYARLAYKPGVTEAPSGGGATYVIPGVAEANGSSVPITDEGKGTLTAIDQQRLLQAATKWSAVEKRPQMLPDIVRKAFRAATSGRGGAAHVVLPEDVLICNLAPGNWASAHASLRCGSRKRPKKSSVFPTTSTLTTRSPLATLSPVASSLTRQNQTGASRSMRWFTGNVGVDK